MDITSLLERGQSPDAKVRNDAEAMLRRLEAENYPAYLLSLCTVFNSTSANVAIQRLAAIILKNTLRAKDLEVKASMKSKWSALNEATRREIHRELLKGLHHSEVDVSCTVSVAVSTVAAIDLPSNAWNDLIPALLQNMDARPVRLSLQKATLETMGYLCEELSEIQNYIVPTSLIDRLLTAIVRGMGNDVTDPSIRLAATRSMLMALEFTEKNFDNEQERNFIMTAVGQSALCSASEQVREAGFECLAKICQIYYHLMAPYMAQLYKLTVDTIQSDQEDVVKQAIEVWSTICEEEIILGKEQTDEESGKNAALHYFAKQACPSLVPVLLDQLTKQEEDQELDECAWTVAMAAGACLSLLAECAGSDVVPLIMPYVQANIRKNEGPDDWHYREAATYAFGAILDGPEEKDLAPIAVSGLGFLLGAMKDQDPRVRNTTAWTIGRTFEFVHPKQGTTPVVTVDNIEAVVNCLLQSIASRDEYHILERVCYALEKLAVYCRDGIPVNLSNYFKTIMEALLKLAFHPVESHVGSRLQAAAFEAINELVHSCETEALDLVVQLIPFLRQKLSELLHVQPTQMDDRIPELQGIICGSLTVVFQRLSRSEGHRIPLNQCAGQTLPLLLEVLQVNGSESVLIEEVMTALSALVSGGVNVEMNVRQFIPYIEKGLRSSADKYTFLSCIGAISDIFVSLGDQMEPYAQGILSVLCEALSSPTVRREIKPPVLSLLGDICLAISDRFQKFLTVVNSILRQATEMAVREMPRSDEEDEDYYNELMLGIIEAYSGIAQGLSQDAAGRFLSSEYSTLIKFMGHLAMDKTRKPYVTTEAVGLLGDMISRTPGFNPNMNERVMIEKFIQESQDAKHENIRKAASRTGLIYTRFLS